MFTEGVATLQKGVSLLIAVANMADDLVLQKVHKHAHSDTTAKQTPIKVTVETK
jgi:acetaldehyde dehydrogenase (acetylating)